MSKRLTVDMDEDLYHEFGVKCAEESVTKADVVRGCVNDWVEGG